MQEQAFLRDEIETALSQEPRISSRIDIEVDGRVVRLHGVVKTLEEKEIAEEIAQRFGPVQLDSHIAVESTHVIEDREVLAAAREALGCDPDLAHDVGVDRVVDGVAYLKGHAESIARISRAADIVAQTPGVKDVVSEATIATDVVITDVDLVSGAMQALRAEPSIYEEFLEASADDGVVTLSGVVDTLDEKRRAAEVVRRLPGVAAVRNAIRVKEEPTSLDQAVENEVVRALSKANINIRNLLVNVLDGVVYLDGTVDTYLQRDKARALAEKVPGVTGVQNDLVIGFHIEKKEKSA